MVIEAAQTRLVSLDSGKFFLWPYCSECLVVEMHVVSLETLCSVRISGYLLGLFNLNRTTGDYGTVVLKFVV